MLKKFQKQFAIFSLMMMLAYSNIPYEVLHKSIVEYEKLQNVVDRMWKTDMNTKVVDNLSSHDPFTEFKVPVAYAATGDAYLQYGASTNSTPKTRFYTNSSNSYGAAGNTVAGTANVSWVVSKESPTEDITVMATQSSTGKLDIFCRTGSTWTKDISNVTIGTTGVTRRFDVEFEKTSGIPMVLYSTNTATTNELSYYRKTGAGCGAGSWTGPTVLNPTRVTGIVLWVELEARQTASSNVLAAAFSDANATAGGKLEAMIWNGSWGNESPAGAAQGWSDLSIELQGTAGANALKVFDLAFETNSGDLLIAWGTSTGTNGTNGWRYATCAATLPCTWSGVLTPAGPTDDATNVACAADPGSDAIACIAAGNSGAADITTWTWTGTAVGAAAANADSSALGTATGDMAVDIDWVVNGSQRMAVGVYGETTTGYRYLYYDTVGNAWRCNGTCGTATTGFTVTGAPATAMQSVQVTTNPSNTSQILVTFTDANSDLWSKRLVYNGSAGGATTALSTWSNADGGVALETTVSTISGKSFWYDWAKIAPSNALTVSTSGTQATTLISGDTAQHIGGGATAAFTLQVASAATVSSVKITDTGTATFANLTNPKLYYETTGICNYSGSESNVTGTYSSETVTFTLPSVALATSPNFTCLYFVADLDSTTTRGGQTIDLQIANPSTDIVVSGASNSDTSAKSLAGTTTILPNATGISFGSGLADGGRSNESITISGAGFGVAPGGSRANCAGAVNTGCVRFTVGGNATVADSSVTAWSNTSITFNIDPTLASYGGTSAVEVVAGGQADTTKLTFFIYPNITGMTTCSSGGDRDSACGTNAAQEYNASDTLGLIQLNGDHFNTSAGTATFTGSFGSLAGTVHGTAEGACSTLGWGSSGTGTSVCLEVNAAISNSVYDGTITLTRTGDSKTDIIDLHILPRIASNTPTSGTIGTVIQIDGDHLCQTGTCPPTPPTADSIAYFGSSQALTADFVTSCTGGLKWSDTRVCVKVPVGTAIGAANTKIQGKATPLYESQRKTFTAISTTPNAPDVGPGTNKGQYKLDETTVISVGGTTTESDIFFKADISASIAVNMALEIEVKDTSLSFDGTGLLTGTVVGGGACNSCTSLAGAKVSSSALTDGTKHWRARVRNTTTGETSSWVSFGGNADGATDVRKDTIAPVITNISSGTPDSNSTAITWDTTGEQSTSQVQYNDTGTFVADCATNNDCTTLDASLVFSHSVTLSNLDSGSVYYYRVRSKDQAGNETISSNNTFATNSVTQPGKTTSFSIMGETSALTATTTKYFTVILPETAPSIKSAFIEVSGLVSGGTEPITVQANGLTAENYSVDATIPTFFTFLYPLTTPNSETSLNLNDADPCTNGATNAFPPPATLSPCNNLIITPGAGMSMNAASAKIFVTYGFTP